MRWAIRIVTELLLIALSWYLTLWIVIGIGGLEQLFGALLWAVFLTLVALWLGLGAWIMRRTRRS